jgi:hypothetical protein
VQAYGYDLPKDIEELYTYVSIVFGRWPMLMLLNDAVVVLATTPPSACIFSLTNW